MTAAGSTESNLSVGRKQKSEQKAKPGRHTALRSEGVYGNRLRPVHRHHPFRSSAKARLPHKYLGSPDQAPPWRASRRYGRVERFAF